MIGARSVEWQTVDILVPAVLNARTHSDDQIARIAASIGRYGFNAPVLVDGDGGIIAGHARVLAARRLGLAKVPVVALSHLSEDEKRAYMLADNKLAELAGWDEDVLGEELARLLDLDFDLEVMGFSDREITDLLPGNLTVEDSDPDDVPDMKEQTVTVLGDIWVLNDHRVICGDSTSADTYEMMMGGTRADLVFTDPPYGMSYDGGTTDAHGMILNDDLRGGDLVALVRDAVGSAVAASEETAPVYVCFPWRTYREFETAMETVGLKTSACIVWDKKSIGLGNAHYRPQHEFIFYCSRGVWYGDKKQSDVWKFDAGRWYGAGGQTDIWSFARESGGKYVHPTQKPVKLIERAVRNSSRRGGVVLDVFGGSGSTLIACERLGRAARVVELDPGYVDVIVRRWQGLTGGSAVLESSGQAFDDIVGAAG